MKGITHNHTSDKRFLDADLDEDMKPHMAYAFQDVDWYKKPLPLDLIRSILEGTMPHSLSPSEKEKWEKRISVTCSLYERYVTTVCGITDKDERTPSRELHSKEWEHLRNQLKTRNPDHLYSLHY
jgi:hypothetical protein